MSKVIVDTLNVKASMEAQESSIVTANKHLFDLEVIEYDSQDGDANSDVVFYRSTCTTCSTS
jgi:hypothetical protein